MHPDAPYFIILLCLTPDDFTRHGKSADTQWVNQTICQSSLTPVVFEATVVALSAANKDSGSIGSPPTLDSVFDSGSTMPCSYFFFFLLDFESTDAWNTQEVKNYNCIILGMEFLSEKLRNVYVMGKTCGKMQLYN